MPDITPRREFYSVFPPRRVADIARSLDLDRELPRVYNYFGPGAHRWDESASCQPRPDYDLLRSRLGYLDEQLNGHRPVDVIDIGAGNGDPARDLLRHLLDRGVLGRYVAVDISPEMLAVVERRVRAWFGASVPFEGHLLDFTRDRLDHLFRPHPASGPVPAHVVLVLGGTLGNLPAPDQTLSRTARALGSHDLLLISERVQPAPRPCDVGDHRPPSSGRTAPGSSPQALSPFNRSLLDLLGVPETCYDVESGVDEERGSEYLRLRLTAPLRWRFEVNGSVRTVALEAEATVDVWRYWCLTSGTFPERLRRAGLAPVDVSEGVGGFVLSVCRAGPPGAGGPASGTPADRDHAPHGRPG